MARTLDFDLNSQSQISPEGTPPKKSSPLPVGQRFIDFSIPDYSLDPHTHPQQVVDKINQYIENIADDYFLLGVHLVALHRMLKQSKMGIEQIKNWYAENINMPYSSAMQCKKVAEVYADNPSLINRYTASGAYLLSSCKSAEEREAIWKEACAGKTSASIRTLRSVLKKHQEHSPLQKPLASFPNEEGGFKMGEAAICQELMKLSEEAQRLQELSHPVACRQQRKYLIDRMRSLIRQMEAPASSI